MKFQLNGALTIGTLDGANVEMREEMGPANIFIFGMTVEQVEEARKRGYNPGEYLNKNTELKLAIEQIGNGFFTPEDPDVLRDIYNNLVFSDHYMLLKDYESYMKSNQMVNEAYQDGPRWANMCVHNIASSGKFSSDRTITEYATQIWGMEPSRKKLNAPHEIPGMEVTE